MTPRQCRQSAVWVGLLVLTVVAGAAATPQNTSTIAGIIETAYGFLEMHLERGTSCDWPLPDDPNVTRCYHYHFCRPSGAHSKYAAGQWLWDSGSHMISWSHRNVTNAILDLRTMLQRQNAAGFIPETIFWPPQSSETNFVNDLYYGSVRETKITQMPVLAYSLRAIWNATRDLELLDEFLPPLIRYWEWWEQQRVFSPDGLISIVHGWESGLDASPMYDEAYQVPPRPLFDQMYPKFVELMLGYHLTYQWNWTVLNGREQADPEATLPAWFYVEDVGVNSIYAAGWTVLGDLASHWNATAAAYCREKGRLFSARIVSTLWNTTLQRFVSRFRAMDGTWHPAVENTVQSLLPLLLPLPSEIEERVLSTQLLNESRYWLPFPLPSTSADSESFEPVFTVDLMWRGPMWAFPTWFVMEALWSKGHSGILEAMLDRWVALVQRSGIWEQYNPIDGAPYGVEGLGMSCLIVDWLYRLGRA